MSSVFAHSLIAVSIYNTRSRSTKNKITNFLWLGWLIVIASFPDLDYIIPALHPSANQGLRITHSIIFSAIAPIITIVVLWRLKINKENLISYAVQAICAGYSHLTLDLLVGVTPLPLLYPLDSQKFRLPFGILPSAGKIDFSNYYLYRNLYLEMGVLLPLCLVLYLLTRTRIKYYFKAIAIFLSFLCSSYFIKQCYLLPR